MPSDLTELQRRRTERSFSQWDGHVAAELVALAEVLIQQLIDRLIELGSTPSVDQVQAEVTRCVYKFNGLDSAWKHSWICTIEREDIGEVLWSLSRCCGVKLSEDYLSGRSW